MKKNVSVIEKITFENIKSQVLKNAYGNDDTFIARLDPRTLFIWYLFFGIFPWLIHDYRILAGLFLFVVVTTKLTKTVPLVLIVFCIGVFSETGFLFLFTILFGGDFSALAPILKLTLKIAVISLASITTFSGMDPDKLGNGMIAIGIPDQFSFSVSYGYRILPILMEEYQNILLSHRLRGARPAANGVSGKAKWLIYQIKIMIQSFYPLMLNMAKRSRTTVEALEIKGYSQSLKNPAIRKMKLSTLGFKAVDYVFLAVSLLYFTAVCFFAGQI